MYVSIFPLFFHCFLLFAAFYNSSFFVISVSIVSLANAHVRVASLEAKLKTTTQALKEADAAKVSANKAAKAAEARAIKAENALAEVAQKQAKREEDVVKQLDGILTSVGSKFSPYCCLLPFLVLVFDFNFDFPNAAEQLGEIIKLHLDCAKDPLLDTVGVLESNWKNVRNILQNTCHLLPRLFVGLFPKMKDEILVGNLRKFVEAFDAPEDSIL
jgi:predicted Holliday junction resolvase-like endonuclease